LACDSRRRRGLNPAVARTRPVGSIVITYGTMFPPATPNAIRVDVARVDAADVPQAASATALAASAATLRTRRG
jgi:hypothetical protein